MDRHILILEKILGHKVETLTPEESKKQTMEMCNMTEEDWEAQKEAFGF